MRARTAWQPWARILLIGLFGLAASLAAAQGIESALSPGTLSQAHARWDDACSNCHVRFDRAAQDRLCVDCHKDVGQDMRQRTGYHGRLPAQACRSCHTEHKGRDARIVVLDTHRFDHAQTDYALRGRHAQVACDACHRPGRKYREAPSDCQACHRKDDVHKGSLGARCESCHAETGWKPARFDHGSTRFALTGRHADTACADCHRTPGDYKGAPRTCVACHRKDDDTKGHKGQFGDRCDTCHGTRAWKPASFNHDADTRFMLRGAHRAVACASCHTGPLFKNKLASDCHSCHQRDDVHKGSVGNDCAACHTERSWKERAKFDHDKTAFPLLGRHVQARCDACHKSAQFKQAPTACVACHKADDRHAGTLGDDCGSCHGARDWKTTAGRFDHDRTRMPLRNAHAAPAVACKACHADARHLRGTPLVCVSCHARDDRHEGQLGRQCERCHDDRSWKKAAAFDHARTRFALVGRHAAATCKDCHTSARFGDAARECAACHLRDDRHHGAFGTQCDSCHNARAWPLWAFDHDRRTRYPLTGAHRSVGCEACHRQPAPPGRPSAPLGSNCIACHRGDDPHDGGFGARCEQCHVSDSWKKVQPLGGRP